MTTDENVPWEVKWSITISKIKDLMFYRNEQEAEAQNLESDH